MWTGLLVTFSAALAAGCLLYNRYWFYDDAFISLRYARHLADGLGPRWNLAGAPVEGFTSPLHVLLLGLLLRLGVPDIVAARALAFGAHAALLVFLWRWVGANVGRTAAVFSVCAVAVSFPLLVWDMGGLESVPFAALLTAGTLLALSAGKTANRRTLWTGALLLGAASFMRMDGLVAAAATLACVAVLWPGTLRRRFIDVGVAALLVAACMVPWEIFRIVYFHAYLPNTYFAKVYGIPLGWRLRSGLNYWHVYLRMPPYLPELLVVLGGLQVARRRVSALSFSLWLWIAAVSAYIVTTGGDHMFAARFMITLIPLIVVALVTGLSTLGAFDSPTWTGTVAAVFIVTSLLQFRNSVLNPRFRDGAGMAGQVIGEYLAPRLPAGSVIALNVAGATPYFADRFTYIDMLGLNDYEIARRNPTPVDGYWLNLVGHIKGDGASVLRRRPDFLLLGPPGGSLANPDAGTLGDTEIARSPSLAEAYQACSTTVTATPWERFQMVRVGIPPVLRLVYYKRRDVPYPCPHD